MIRPGDANETAVAWRVALETRDRPVVLVLSRQNLPTLDRSRYASAYGLRRGAYVLSEVTDRQPALILIASGSEAGLIMAEAGVSQGWHRYVGDRGDVLGVDRFGAGAGHAARIWIRRGERVPTSAGPG